MTPKQRGKAGAATPVASSSTSQRPAILADIRPRRDVDAADFSDLTASVQTGPAYWDPTTRDVLVIPMTPEPTATEQVKIRRRLVTADAADEQRLADLIAARATATSLFERLWLDTELAKYGEPAP